MANGFLDREFPMSDKNYAFIQSTAYQLTGIHLTDHKQNMIYSRLARRMRALNLNHFDEYCELLGDDESHEVDEFVNAITTNLTAFFRENHHFEFLRDSLIPHLIKRNSNTKKIRIWSAGCSTGEEPHSIAMVLFANSILKGWDVKILATDLDTNVVDHGKKGIYAKDRVDSVPDEYKKYIQQDANSDQYSIADEVRSLISFKPLNLLQQWPMKGPFDLIFCRNVVIYFDAPTQSKLFNRYADILQSDGHLIIGHSENLNKVCDRFKTLGKTIYQREK